MNIKKITVIKDFKATPINGTQPFNYFKKHKFEVKHLNSKEMYLKDIHGGRHLTLSKERIQYLSNNRYIILHKKNNIGFNLDKKDRLIKDIS